MLFVDYMRYVSKLNVKDGVKRKSRFSNAFIVYRLYNSVLQPLMCSSYAKMLSLSFSGL